MASGSIGWFRRSILGGFYGAIGWIKYLKKIRNYSRMPLTNADKYIIMANMTNNNNNNVFSERFTMNNFFTIVFAFVSVLPIVILFVL